ncbi:MAG: tRNA uridine-5-carboxymethylaminomethyl(34) synthesis GTPase MnmE [Alphaproteobacteria bacterium]|nr:tRNA uridine-5-carboxymethylaminomethyl(34) synthesis GTPase MnmE [Alphaproteobacteria bacterium]
MAETIYALSSGAGVGGVAVVRISGPGVDAVLTALGVAPLPAPRYAALHNILCPISADILDQALVLRFPGPGSFTGEDVAELHIHGGEAVLAAVLSALQQTELARMAENGEFTRRAFENGKLDLTGAEAVGDLVAARTDEQRKLALRQYDGGLADLYEAWRSELIDLLGYAEAEIDFSDEELPEALQRQVLNKIIAIKQRVKDHSHTSLLGEQIRSGFPISILGAPNAGKSSLMNLLSRRDVAIVSEVAGTTRDVIEVQMNLAGYAVSISDTAGIRDSNDQIEAEGVRRAEQEAKRAALKIVVIDATVGILPDRLRSLIDSHTLVVVNKSDLAPVPSGIFDGSAVTDIRLVSAKTGDGIEELVADITKTVEKRLSAYEGPVPTRQRHREALQETVTALDRAEAAALPELAAEDIRLAARALGRITGRVDIDDILDTVFRDFCIGK